MDDPVWISVARKYVGLKEVQGPQNNPKIGEWLAKLKLGWRDDATPWCGTFLGGVLIESGLESKVVAGPAGAQSWLKLPVKLDKPAYGCVVVFWRGKPTSGLGHVGFVVGKDQAGHLMVLGGNQGDMVSIKPFGLDRVKGYRWPGTYPNEERFRLPVLTSDGRLSQNEA